MATGFELARRGRVRQWLRSDAPASKGAWVFMFVSALLCGAALAGLLFVGVWRHTAGEAASSRAAQVSDHRALQDSRRTVAALKVQLGHEQDLLARSRHVSARTATALSAARSALAQAQAALARTQAAARTARSAMAVRLSGLSAAASGLARATATLRSELMALETYAAQPGPTGIDAGYLAAQVRYLEVSAAAAASAAGDLQNAAAGASAGE
jgi:hypothetical protein